MNTPSCLQQSFCRGVALKLLRTRTKNKNKRTSTTRRQFARCTLMCHTRYHLGRARCGAAACTGAGVHMQHIAQTEAGLCWLDTEQYWFTILLAHSPVTRSLIVYYLTGNTIIWPSEFCDSITSFTRQQGDKFAQSALDGPLILKYVSVLKYLHI